MELVKLLVSLEALAYRCAIVIFRTPPKGYFCTTFSSLLSFQKIDFSRHFLLLFRRMLYNFVFLYGDHKHVYG